MFIPSIDYLSMPAACLSTHLFLNLSLCHSDPSSKIFFKVAEFPCQDECCVKCSPEYSILHLLCTASHFIHLLCFRLQVYAIMFGIWYLGTFQDSAFCACYFYHLFWRSNHTGFTEHLSYINYCTKQWVTVSWQNRDSNDKVVRLKHEKNGTQKALKQWVAVKKEIQFNMAK